MGDESKLKIWVMTNEFEPKIIGGLGVVATQLTRMLSKLGAKVTVLCSGNTDQLRFVKQIRWVERTPHKTVQRMYGSYGAVINPSKKESFCLVALEAMANGVPLISTTSGGLKEFVTPQNAQIIHSIDSAHIAQAIKEFWNNPEQSKERAINARTTAAQYQWPVIAREYLSLFSDLKEGRP